MTAASRPPDDTPREPSVTEMLETVANWKPAPVAPDDTLPSAADVLGILKPYRVAPDDTPTRQLTDVEKQVEKTPSGRLVLEQLWKAEDDVSRLQQELHEKNQAGMHAVTEISRLQQENALLRRSLEMLTKQLNEQDERITELTFTIIRANSPA